MSRSPVGDYHARERLVFDAILNGSIVVHEDGTIWRHKRTTTYRGKSRLVDIQPRRCDHVETQGYCVVKIGYTALKAHRIAWMFFAGSIPEGMEINHKNGVKSDNRISNLELVTRNENIRHAVRTGLARSGERHQFAKLTEEQVREIRRRHDAGETHRAIARDFPVSYHTVFEITKRKVWARVA